MSEAGLDFIISGATEEYLDLYKKYGVSVIDQGYCVINKIQKSIKIRGFKSLGFLLFYAVSFTVINNYIFKMLIFEIVFYIAYINI